MFNMLAVLRSARTLAVYLAVLVWWIVCLWIDEPGRKAADSEQPTANSEQPTANRRKRTADTWHCSSNSNQ